MLIKELIKDLDIISFKNFNNNIDIKNLSCNTTESNPNGIYFCLKGGKVDGHNFAQEAVDKGAVCLVVENFLPVEVMQIKVEDSRRAMSEFASNFYNTKNLKLKLIALTGTNGKTTTTFLLKSYLSKLGHRVGLIGTQGVYFNNLLLPAKLTTPDPIDLHKILYDMSKTGIEYVVMEASAHAIALHKLTGLKFEVVGLTNITEDHLDFFKSMDNYAMAKEKVFENAEKAVINIDDDYCHRIYNNLSIDKSSVSLYNEGDFELVNYDCSTKGSKAVIRYNDENLYIKNNLVGKYNIANSMMALAILNKLGFSVENIVDVINTTKVKVPGRFNLLNIPADYSVIVDYAHTPDGVENVLKTARELTNGKIIVVFGCGGDRDNQKRPIMGEIANKLADFAVVTSDNPRSENPNSIINEITKNMRGNFTAIADRKQAINYALNSAQASDLILILGKGAENYQEIKGVKYPFSDYDVVDEYFKLKQLDKKVL